MTYKQAIIVRTDIKMGKGKLAAQVAHAAVDSFYKVYSVNPSKALEWIRLGQKKVVLKVSSLNELLNRVRRAEEEGIICSVIRDAGHTQLEPGTITCAGLGPDVEEAIDRVVGDLKLLRHALADLPLKIYSSACVAM